MIANNNTPDKMRSSNMHTMFYNPNDDDKKSIFGGEDAMSIYSGINS